MPFTREQALAALRLWNPAPVFLDSYASRKLPEHLDIFFGPPEEFFIAPDTQDVYTGGRLVPILDDGNFGLITFHDAAGTLVEKDIEAPDETQATYRNWQQYLAGLMLRIGEAVDDDDRVRRIAGLVGLRFTEELFLFWQRSTHLSGEEYHQARREFVEAQKP